MLEVLFVFVIIKLKKGVSNVLSNIGMASLIIMIFHHPLQFETFRIVNGLNGNINIISAIVSYFVAVIMPLICYNILKKNKSLSKIFLPIKNTQN